MADDPSGDIIVARQLVNSTVVQLNQLAVQAYNASQQSLVELYNAIKKLAVTAVDIGVADDVVSRWTKDPGIKTDLSTIYSSYLSGPSLLDNLERVTAYLPEAIAAPSSITKPLPVVVGAQPTGDPYDDADRPDPALSLATITIPSLGTLPAVTAVPTVMDVDVLTAEFSFTEPTYSEHVSPEVEAGIKRVLGGTMGLPQSYWDALWAEVSGALARQQVGKLRMARNRGAASFWALPGETVLAASRAVQDEGARAISQARLEQAKQQAVFAREDFWQAIQQGIAYENQWIAFHQQLAARALASAEQLVNLRVAVHNANIARFNAVLETAKANTQLQTAVLEAAIKAYAAQLSRVTAQIEAEKLQISAYQAQWSMFQTDTAAQISSFGERVKWWMGQTDVDAKYEALKLGKNKADVDRYAAQLSRIGAVASGTAQLINSRAELGKLLAHRVDAETNWEQTFNNFSLELGKLTQDAQKAKATLDVQQAQWLQGQSHAMLQNIAQLTSGFSQAAVAAARVGLSSNVSYQGSDNFNTNASRNSEKVW